MEPVDANKVRAQIERAKNDREKLLSYLDQAEDGPNAMIALAAMRYRKGIQRGTETPLQAIRFLARSAEYFASLGGFIDV